MGLNRAIRGVRLRNGAPVPHEMNRSNDPVHHPRH
jgi:hypothetical protein